MSELKEKIDDICWRLYCSGYASGACEEDDNRSMGRDMATDAIMALIESERAEREALREALAEMADAFGCECGEAARQALGIK